MFIERKHDIFLGERAKCYILVCLFSLKVYTGPYRNPRRNRRNQQPLEEASEEAAVDNSLAPVDLDKLSVDQYVAVYKEEWSNRPPIGQVENVGPAMVTVRWLDGSYNGTFRDSFFGSGANRKPWSEDITKTQIVMIGVQFTRSRRIKRNSIDELKARYRIIDHEQDSNHKNST